MKNTFAAFTLLATIAVASRAAEFKFGNQILKVPDSYEIELVTTTNLVKRPVAMDFDEQGRLYVTDSSGSSEKGPTQYEQKNHRVMRLEDTDGDGKFDKSTTFADNMMFPEGCMYLDGSVYVGAPPSIWKLTDTNNDGVADARVEWHQGKTLTGCANDIHGPYLGPDGWIYWCKGAFQEQSYEVNGKPWSSKAAHIFRARPDHTRIEPVLTGGMDNPVAVAFSPEGERFLAGTFFEPGIPGRRDGVIHAIYGGVYGKQNDVLEGHKRTGELMPVMTHLGAAASCSVIFYRSKIFGDDFQNNMLVCNFNLHNVTRHVLEPDGATFKTKDSVFLSCENDPDFHPTCVLEDADGSLLVIDTGGWYKICCPTSQLYKPDVLGAIYRIKKVGVKKVEDPRGLKIEWAKSKPVELTEFLDDKRPYVVTRAIHQLAKRKGESVPALREILKNPETTDARRNAVWALTQIDYKDARHAVYSAFPDINSTLRPGDTVAQTAFHSISLWRDWESVWGEAEAFPATIALSAASSSENRSMRRIAAEVWGRIGDKQKEFAVHNLLSEQNDGREDRILEHSIIYALIELDDPKATANGLTNALTQRIALIALDQMDGGGLKPEQVTPLLTSKEKRLKETALWIVSHHPEWGSALTGFFREQLARTNFVASEADELQNLLVQFAGDASVQELLASTARDSKSKDARIIALHAMTRAGLKPAPQNWLKVLETILGEDDGAILRADIAAIRTLTPLAADGKKLNMIPGLTRLACNEKLPEDLRVEALAALPSRYWVLDEVTFGFLCQSLEPQKPLQQRNSAAFVLVHQMLTDRQLTWLAAEEIKRVGPMEVLKLLPAFERSTNEAVGLKLIESLKESKAAASLRAEILTNRIAKFPASVKKAADEFLASLNTDAAAQRKHIDELLAGLKDGDIRRGQAIFNSSKAACSACHAIGYAGGHVGPDLTNIGKARTERDLLEAIVYPSASFVRSFDPMIVSTKSDEDYSGILKKDSADEIILVTGPNAEVKIARADIKEMRPGAVSVMPQGLDTQLTKQELTDLVTFLKATKW